ncbi:MAG: hypothetical protein ORN98_07395, partial [Alphaproteobacteria bacterium]|nr:hypothetical protein [Alphaproteobacteria bacterium]
GEAVLYFFDEDARKASRDQLAYDIPKLITDNFGRLPFLPLLKTALKETASHGDDIKSSIINSPELTIITENGNKRRSINGIKSTDIVIRNPQRSLYLLPGSKKK